jgi:hypothetical protein
VGAEAERRAEIEQHWAASEASDTDIEHRLYATHRAVVRGPAQPRGGDAIKHAPGAAIDVTVVSVAHICVAVTNDAPRESAATVAVPGSGRGNAGLTERVHAANGTVSSGPTLQAGWRLSAELPR